MATKIVMIHGRNQASDERTAADPALLQTYVTQKKLQFLAGLAKGLVLAQRPPIDASAVIFPFYGNDFAKKIAEFEAGGGIVPELESIDDQGLESIAGDPTLEMSALQAQLLQNMAERLNFNPYTELSYTGDESLLPEGRELTPDDLLRIPFLTGALQFLSRKTGVPAAIIRRYLADVAYYLAGEGMRDSVLDIVRTEIAKNSNAGDDLIVIGHSLGSVVAYDLLAANDDTIGKRNILLLVTAGCPLGFEVVKKRVLGRGRSKKPKVPGAVPQQPGSWVNAYDVLDFVALIHPLRPEFTEAVAGQITDERTNNPTGPHDIIDYLADPDVAAPISRAVARGS